MAFLYRLQPPRPGFAQDMSPDEAEVMSRHVGYWQDLLDREVALAFGPVHDPQDPWGLGLLSRPYAGGRARSVAPIDSRPWAACGRW
jgi:hypothetical protein